jgi:hypothetical protein
LSERYLRRIEGESRVVRAFEERDFRTSPRTLLLKERSAAVTEHGNSGLFVPSAKSGARRFI